MYHHLFISVCFTLMWAKLVIACTSVIMLPWSNFYLCINYVLLMHNALMELHFFSKTKLVKVFLKFYLMITIYLIFVFRKLGKAFSKHHANICKHPWLECYRLPMDWMVLLHLHASLFRWTFFFLQVFHCFAETVLVISLKAWGKLWWVLRPDRTKYVLWEKIWLCLNWIKYDFLWHT